MEFDLAKNIHKLLWEEPFFASVSKALIKVPTNEINTLGVRYDKDYGEYVLAYNPDFCSMVVEKFGPQKMTGVLMHEFLHLMLGHVSGRKPDNVSHNKWNIATDLSINSLSFMLPYMSDFKWKDSQGNICKALIPGQSPYENLLPEQASEYYLVNLPDEEQEEGHGSHDGWGAEIDDDDDSLASAAQELAKEKINKIIQKASDKANQGMIEGRKNAWGSIGRNIQRKIAEIGLSKIDPKKILRYFCNNTIKSNKRKSISKVNRRFPYIRPGKRWEKKAYIAVSIDESGSVPNSLIEDAFNFLSEMSKDIGFWVIPFDHQVFEDKVFFWNRGEKVERKRVLCGGTDFDAPTRYVNDMSLDGHIIITDMMAPKPIPSKCKRIWITTKRCKQHMPFTTNETVVVLEEN